MIDEKRDQLKTAKNTLKIAGNSLTNSEKVTLEDLISKIENQIATLENHIHGRQ